MNIQVCLPPVFHINFTQSFGALISLLYQGVEALTFVSFVGANSSRKFVKPLF